MKKRYSLFLIAALTMLNASAQNLEWAKGMGGTVGDAGSCITVDNSGNVYTSGFFAGTADFDPGAGVFNLSSVGQYDAFIQKLDAAGNFMWAKGMGGTNNDEANAIAIDVSGNIYVSGHFWNTVDFDPGPGTFNLSAAGVEDIFILKLDAAGNFLWAKSMGSTGVDRSISIALDASANVYTTGYFWNTVDFDPDLAGTFNLTSAGTNDIFIQKLDASGNFVWAKQMGGIGMDLGNAITTDDLGNVYSTGYFQVTVDFDPGAGIQNLSVAGGNYWDVFIQKLDFSGNYVWAKQMGGIFDDAGYAIITDAAGNVYTTGYYYDVADFDPGAGTFNLTSAGGRDVFIQKLDASGNLVWVKSVGGGGMEIGYFIGTDGSGNVYTAGYFSASGDFNPGPGNFILTSAGWEDVFIQKLDASGNFVWALGIGATGSDGSQAVTLDGSGNVYATGWFQQTADFDPGPGIFNLTAAGSTEVFALKLSETPLPIELISFTADLIDNTKVRLNWTTASEMNNDYFTVERSVNVIDWEKITQVNGCGNSTSLLNYQAWDYIPYPGISYYRLKQTDYDGKFSLSKSIAVDNTGNHQIIISPNPASDFISIFFENNDGYIETDILNALGETIIQTKNQNRIVISQLPSGIYFVKTKTGNNLCSQKFIKQ